jgi:hypothetical protein
MTQLANEEAMMSLLPGLRDFTFEPQYWANKLDTIVRTPAVMKSLRRTKDSDVCRSSTSLVDRAFTDHGQGVDYSNKIANLMRTLDVEELHTYTFIEIALAGSVMEAMQSVYLIKSPESAAKATEWVKEVVKRLILTALNKNRLGTSLEMDKGVREGLIEDILIFEKENGLDSSKSPQDRAIAVLDILEKSTFLDTLSNGLSPLDPDNSADTADDGGDDGKNDDDDGDDGNDELETALSTGVEGFNELWNNTYESLIGKMDDSPKVAAAKSLLSIAYVSEIHWQCRDVRVD